MKANPTQLRSEFYALPEQAWVDRAMTAAAAFASTSTMEALATKGDGPPYVCTGRRALYVKADVLAWIAGRVPPT